MFTLHPRLEQDCFDVGRFSLCRLLLMNDANYPWFILVPQRAGLSEIHQLADAELAQFWHESALLSRSLSELFRPDKLNLAALGNLVPQLHIHHIVRYRDDAAWPAPVWGLHPARPYAEAEANALLERLRGALAGELAPAG